MWKSSSWQAATRNGIKDVNKVLCTIERANNFDIKAKLQEQADQQAIKDQRLRHQLKKNERTEKAEDDPSNNYSTGKCRLQDQTHEWSECQNNPRSKNYNVTHYATVREKERANLKRPRDKGELNMIHDTSDAKVVKFEDPGNFVDFSDNESVHEKRESM